MSKIVYKKMTVEGDISSFEETQEGIIFYFNDKDCQLRVVDEKKTMIRTMNVLTLKGIKDATINFNSGKIEL